MVIAFLKETPSFVKKHMEGGQFNGYLLIPIEYLPSKRCEYTNMPMPHGGVTLELRDPERIKEFIDYSATFWENMVHLDYSKYFCVGFDTLHLEDTWERWNMDAVWDETLRWKKAVEEYIKKYFYHLVKTTVK